MHAIANLEKDGRVRLFIGSNKEDLAVLDATDGYRRATARLTRQQAIALAYRLLHAANDVGQDDICEVAPASTLRSAR